SDFKYSFHADVEFDTVEQFYDVIKKIEPITEEVKIYGIYKNGKTVPLPFAKAEGKLKVKA
ncbi:MAG: hypothetical protein ABIU77_25910, partial [Ferruginibacter sp.]